MIMKKTFFLTIALLVSMIGVFSFAAQAQQNGETIEAGKDGKFHLAKPLKVGDKTLAAGMYRVRHVKEGDDNILVFEEVGMEEMPGMDMSKEAARVKSPVEPLDKNATVTKLVVAADQTGELRAVEVWIKGEKFKHVFAAR